MTKQPQAAPSYRVPRSGLDSFFDKGSPSGPLRLGAGNVLSIESETVTVLMHDSIVPGVAFYTDENPGVGDLCEVWSLNEVLFTPGFLAVDDPPGAYVSPDPPGPVTLEINIAGSFRDDSWFFEPLDEPSWQREATEELTGLRVTRQPALPGGWSRTTHTFTGMSGSPQLTFSHRTGIGVVTTVDGSNNAIAFKVAADGSVTEGAPFSYWTDDPRDNLGWPIFATDYDLFTSINRWDFGNYLESWHVDPATLAITKTHEQHQVNTVNPEIYPLFNTPYSDVSTGLVWRIGQGNESPRVNPPKLVHTTVDASGFGSIVTETPSIYDPQLSDSALPQRISDEAFVLHRNQPDIADALADSLGMTWAGQPGSLWPMTLDWPGGLVIPVAGSVRPGAHSPSTDDRSLLRYVAEDIEHLVMIHMDLESGTYLVDEHTTVPDMQGEVIPPEHSLVSAGFTESGEVYAIFTDQSGESTCAVFDVFGTPIRINAGPPTSNGNLGDQQISGWGDGHAFYSLNENYDDTRNPVLVIYTDQGGDSGATTDHQGTLWSDAPFDVRSGDLLDFTVDATYVSGTTAVMTPIVAWGAASAFPLPGSGDTATVEAPSVAVNGNEHLIGVTVVPPRVGSIVPLRARFGLRFTTTSPDLVDLLLTHATLSRTTSTDHPVGQTWLDPAAEIGGLPTVDTSPQSGEVAFVPAMGVQAAAVGEPGEFAVAPAFTKVSMDAPADTGGILSVLAQGTFTGSLPSGGPLVELRLASDAEDGSWPSVTLHGPQAFMLFGNVRVAPGQRTQVWAEYRFLGNPVGATTLSGAVISPTFLPGAHRSGGEARPPLQYWDGDTWRPPALQGARVTYDDPSAPPVTKTPTVTTLVSTPDATVMGGLVTLAASVDADAIGSVMFSLGGSETGPWTGFGSAPLLAGVATRTWIPTGPGTSWVRARYQGSPTHEASEAVTGPVTVAESVRTVTLTSTAAWVQPYDEAGDQIAEDRVEQGLADETVGNRCSLVGFDLDLPADATVLTVTLRCRNWASTANEVGMTVEVGYHDHPSAPSTYVPDEATQLSEHQVAAGAFEIGLSWAAEVLQTDASFAGVVVGPGVSSGSEYVGEAGDGPDPWELVVVYQTSTPA